MLKILFAIAVLLVVTVRTSPLQSTSISSSNEVTIIALEEPCVRQGGICVRTEDCDPNDQAVSGLNLCAKQRHLGVVCCYDF